MKKTLIACLLIAALLMALPSLRVSRAETDPFAYSIEAEGPVAENLTHHCRLTSDLKSTAYTWRLTDADLNSSQILKDGQRVTLTWREGIPVKTIWMAFKDYPAADSFTFHDFPVGLYCPHVELLCQIGGERTFTGAHEAYEHDVLREEIP